jgi:folate-binding protein YgfZ
VDAITAALANAGAVPAAMDAFEIARIEAGIPFYGLDISDKNLPQEVNRDAQAISFTKGCYLGQETVARIDALGHVNRVLVGVRFAGTVPPPTGTEVFPADGQGSEGKSTIGAVTSAAYSHRLGAPLALAYVRRGHNQTGTQLGSPIGPAQVISLPL